VALVLALLESACEIGLWRPVGLLKTWPSGDDDGGAKADDGSATCAAAWAFCAWVARSLACELYCAASSCSAPASLGRSAV